MTKKPERLKFDESLERLEALIERLESGDLALEESLAAFREGAALVARCRELLKDAEAEIAALTSEGKLESIDVLEEDES